MTFLATARVNYPARLQRSGLLAARYPFAAEVLSFYKHIAAFQKDLYESLPNRWGKQGVAAAGGEFRSQRNFAPLLESFLDFLGVVERRGPGPLASEARHLRESGATQWAQVLGDFWWTGLESPADSGTNGHAGNTAPLQEFLARAFLQPVAEFVSGAMLPPVLPMTMCRCPRCNSLPLLGVLRPEGDGGKRYLQCSFCSHEWEFRRIFCAHCREEQEQKLAVYIAEEFPQIRVETCESCKHFLRTVDLTKDGHAVPLVDDLAAIPLSLWAEENGYKRIQANLFGT
jgi:FdhE protein